MESLLNLGAWVRNHWVELGVAAGYAVATARLIVKLTPSPADDTALAAVMAVLKHLGLQLPSAAKSEKEDA